MPAVASDRIRLFIPRTQPATPVFIQYCISGRWAMVSGELGAIEDV
jgi:hypothetical protein